MRSCEHGPYCIVIHDEHDSCPLCEAEKKIEDLKDEIADLENQLENYE